MKKTSSRLKEVADLVTSAERFLITAHERPDGDAIGSILAMGSLLKEHGKDVVMYTQDEVPSGLSFLPGVTSIEHSVPDWSANSFCLVVLDCNEIERVGEEGPGLLAKCQSSIILDHHLGEGFCNGVTKPCCSVIDTSASATGQICYELFMELGWNITKDVATCIYAAILTDTGGFRYSNTNGRTFELARELVEAGADPYGVALSCFESKPLSKLKLLGLALETLEVYYNGLLSIMTLTPEMFELCGSKESETDDFVSYARAIDTVEMAALIKEAKPGTVSVSLRSKRFVNVAELAGRFGGGGHFNAAGFRVSGNPLDVKERLIELAGQYLTGGKS
ncbi:MAG: bifunctional oligoribonuclease/PAP phosphatase NrnA [Thermodesulfobacteria bacterium]|nr:bifunctional oligoribonuclease/PAP phosphatase NrnA [Thermodesulfobacteriota bacterium]